MPVSANDTSLQLKEKIEQELKKLKEFVANEPSKLQEVIGSDKSTELLKNTINLQSLPLPEGETEGEKNALINVLLDRFQVENGKKATFRKNLNDDKGEFKTVDAKKDFINKYKKKSDVKTATVSDSIRYIHLRILLRADDVANLVKYKQLLDLSEDKRNACIAKLQEKYSEQGKSGPIPFNQLSHCWDETISRLSSTTAQTAVKRKPVPPSETVERGVASTAAGLSTKESIIGDPIQNEVLPDTSSSPSEDEGEKHCNNENGSDVDLVWDYFVYPLVGAGKNHNESASDYLGLADDKILFLSNENTELRNENKQLEQQLKQSEGSQAKQEGIKDVLATVRALIASPSSEIKPVIIENGQLQREKAALAAEVESYKTALSELEKLNKQLAEKQGEAETNLQLNQELEAKVPRLEDKLSALEQAKQQIADRVSDLQAQLMAKDAELIKSQEANDNLEQAKQKLQETLDSKTQGLNDIQQQVTDLEQEKATLLEKIEQKKNEIAILGQEKDANQVELSMLNTGQQEQLKELQEQLDTKAKELSESEQQLSQLAREKEALESKVQKLDEIVQKQTQILQHKGELTKTKEAKDNLGKYELQKDCDNLSQNQQSPDAQGEAMVTEHDISEEEVTTPKSSLTNSGEQDSFDGEANSTSGVSSGGSPSPLPEQPPTDFMLKKTLSTEDQRWQQLMDLLADTRKKSSERFTFSDLELAAVTHKSADQLNEEIDRLNKLLTSLNTIHKQQLDKIKEKLLACVSPFDNYDGLSINLNNNESFEFTKEQKQALIHAIVQHIIKNNINNPNKWGLSSFGGRDIDLIFKNIPIDLLSIVSNKRIISAAIKSLYISCQSAINERREDWQAIQVYYHRHIEGIGPLCSKMEARIAILEDMQQQKQEDSDSVYLPNNCRIIYSAEELSQPVFQASGSLFHRKDELKVRESVTYSQSLTNNKQQVWSVTRTTEQCLEYKTPGKSNSWYKDFSASPAEVVFTQMLDAVNSFNGSKVVHFSFAHCSKDLEIKYRIFIMAYNELGLDTKLYCNANNKIKIPSDIESAKDAIRNKLTLYRPECDKIEQAMPRITPAAG